MVATTVVTIVLYGAIGIATLVASILLLVFMGSVLNGRKKYPSKTAHATESSATLAPFLTTSATHLAAMIRQRKITSLEAVRAFSDQIIRVNKHLNAICGTRFDEAEREAREADQRIDECYTLAGNDPARLKELLDALPPFHGVPCTIKECFRLTGMSWTSGLRSRAQNIAEFDATAVKRMRDGGFIPLANTNTRYARKTRVRDGSRVHQRERERPCRGAAVVVYTLTHGSQRWLSLNIATTTIYLHRGHHQHSN